ncbi:MAG TPA: PTS sugar transporter subunit IIA [Phycisphaeraceae bacterium]|nr:PTS sugar transporter subunit IIA [Phycisphaeraceae bacterium]
MKLSEIVVRDAIRTDMQATDRDSVITELVDALVQAGSLPPELHDEIIEALLEREKRGSTGFGRGVAVPHAKHPALPAMVATVGISKVGVDFNALDNQPVYSIFLLLSPEDNPEEHLKAMEAIFGSLSQEMFRRFLRQTTTTDDVISLIAENDDQKIGS